MCDSDHVQICTKSLDHAFRCLARSASGSVIDRDRLSTRSVDDHLVWMASSSERDGDSSITHIKQPVAEAARAVSSCDADPAI